MHSNSRLSQLTPERDMGVGWMLVVVSEKEVQKYDAEILINIQLYKKGTWLASLFTTWMFTYFVVYLMLPLPYIDLEEKRQCTQYIFKLYI